MDTALISNSAFIKSFTAAIIKVVATRKISFLKKEAINFDLIPNMSEKIIMDSMRIKKIAPDLANLPRPPSDLSSIPPPPMMLMARVAFPIPINYTPAIQEEYGKISQLLKEESITSIECNGENKELTITRSGEKQVTKIVLNEDEIKNFLKIVAQKANIPITEGVFKAQADNFEVNAVLSEVIGARFIIRKITPYNLIDKKNAPTMNI